MGLAWIADDSDRAVMPAAGQFWAAPGPRHRRPTLLVRGGQAVACRISAITRAPDLPGQKPSASGPAAGHKHRA
jgi:hypothetical protein